MADSKKIEEMLFEDDSFSKECLDAFDANVALIEKEYAVASKSA